MDKFELTYSSLRAVQRRRGCRRWRFARLARLCAMSRSPHFSNTHG